jgi:hypothetical protein
MKPMVLDRVVPVRLGVAVDVRGRLGEWAAAWWSGWVSYASTVAQRGWK